MKSLTDTISSAFLQIERLLLGREKSPLERGIFHRLSLIAFFAWVGLGADGLSSSCYGPEAAYLALHGQNHLALLLALAVALTVGIIAASYTQIIRLFPGGGGGYLVASRLLSPTAGVVSGCALVVDYVLTIAISIASGVDALLSYASRADSPAKIPLCLLAIFALMILNLRGVKESVRTLAPVFLLFVVTHVVLIAGTIASHSAAAPELFRDSLAATGESVRTLGLLSTVFIFLRAFTLGAGTFTGIEAVSNGIPVLREPRVRTARRTMLYMAVSLAATAGGILVCYRLIDIHPEPGRTLNATLLHAFAARWDLGHPQLGALFVALALLAEGALLFVAAQAGFVDGPRTLAFMAVDRWAPNRFANLSSRLVTGNGIVLMGTAAAAAVIYTRASVMHLVVMYSINVFVTFTLSQLGMVRHWWQVRRSERAWGPHLVLNGVGMVISLGILVATVTLKFFHGGWVTVMLTGGAVALAFLIRRHYRRFQYATTMLNLLVDDRLMTSDEPGSRPEGRVAAIFVNRYDGMGLHTLSRVRWLLGKHLDRVIFLSVAQVDSDQFRNEEHIEALRLARHRDLERYEAVARAAGLEAESRFAVGTDVVEELEKLAGLVAEKSADTLFVAGQVVFQKESPVTRFLHNDVAFALQRRLIAHGLNMVIVPVQLPPEAW